jgi:hypothetical protein
LNVEEGGLVNNGVWMLSKSDVDGTTVEPASSCPGEMNNNNEDNETAPTLQLRCYARQSNSTRLGETVLPVLGMETRDLKRQ